MAEQLTQQLGATWQNELAEHTVKKFREVLKMLLTNYMQDGHLPLTSPLKSKDQAAYLVSPEAHQQAVTMLQDMDGATRAQGMKLWNEIQEARNGQPQGS